MRITEKRWTYRRRGSAGIAVGGLLAALMATPVAADTAPPTGPVADRVAAVAAWKAGGPAVKRAAETALAGSDSEVKAFLASGQGTAAEQDLRSRVEELIAASGPRVREAAKRALGGSATDVQAFVDTGYQMPFEDDQRLLLSQIMSVGGPRVRGAAGRALDGSIADVREFLSSGQYLAQEDDDRLKLSQLMSTGGPEVKKAAGAALDGSVEDVREYLRYGYQTAAAHDQETLTVAQLADLTKNASDRAGKQAMTAKDAAAKAVEATALAKQAAERANAETKAAQGEASKASTAAGRAADAANRAAKAAQTASGAAAAANEAARQASSAAAAAAKASALAGDAATKARKAAADAAGDASKAAVARDLAVTARKAAADARTAGEASAWAGRAAGQAGLAAQAAVSAGDNAQAAAQAALDAAGQSGVASEASDNARQAADRAKTAAAAARRAAAATVKIAADAAAAGADAQRASNTAASHAEAAADAADAAASHAGDASTAASTAQAAATEAQAAATSAGEAATQAHKVADIARASDTERLAAQQDVEVAKAEQAYFEEARKAKQAAWESGKATQLATDTSRLITEATAAGVDQPTAVTKGRQAATRLLTAGGPWVKAAAQTALESHDGDVLAFLSSDLALARERDDRASVIAIAQGATKLEQRLAAETASVGTPEQVRAFLATGQYPGKDDDDRLRLSQIMSTGGPRVREAAGKALDGTIADVRTFLATGQYSARDDDNRLLVSQALASGGSEVKEAAQAVLSGPASGLEPFLNTGLPKARQRDAFTAAHIATIASYLQAIDGNTALARQYAAQAAQSFATAHGAANEARSYANQAQASATEAADWAFKAAESARQAQASADQAAAYAKQARAADASAQATARTADYSAAAAAGYNQQAQKYAADAKTASDKARDSAVAAGKSRDEADAAAKEAAQLIMAKQVADSAAGKLQSDTAVVDNNGRVTFVEGIPRSDVKPTVIREDQSKCVEYDPIIITFFPGNWREEDGKTVCDLPVTVKVTGTIDYYLKTCPEPNLSIAACQGKYTTWDTVFIRSEPINTQYDTTAKTEYKSTDQRIWEALTGDFVKCWNNLSVKNASCAWAASNFIPYGALAKGAKGLVAFRFALETGVELEQAKLALQASLEGTSDAVKLKLLATADSVTAFRNSLKDGVGTDAALDALRNDHNVERALVAELEGEAKVASAVRTACPINSNSFPAGTPVLMADGTSRPIEHVRVGDSVTATDPETGATSTQHVENTIYTPDDRDFTEFTIAAPNGSTSAITSTSHHPYWSENAHDWRDAADLTAGDTLRTPKGEPVRITDTRHWTTLQSAYNLTISNVHTYYVLADGTPVLVHNSDADLCNIGEHLVLGIFPYSDRVAETVAARTYNDPKYGSEFPGGDGRPIWMVGVDRALGTPGVNISVSLDGVDGAKTADQALAMLVERGQPLVGDWRLGASGGNGTAWEMAILRLKVILGRRSWESVTWYWGGKDVTKEMTKPEWANPID